MKARFILNTCLAAGLLAGSSFMTSSCTDLSETPYSVIDKNQYQFTDDDIQSMFGSIYSSLRLLYWGWEGLFDSYEESSDLIMTPLRIGVGWGTYYTSLHKHSFNYTISHFYNIWYYCYQGINNCNKLLDMDIVKKDETSSAQLRAFRALNYYILFDNFRNIPLDITYNHEAGFTPEQEDPQKVFDFIVSELNEVKEKVGEKTDYGKINKYACNMILAKMYLNHNAWFGTEDKTWYEKAYDEVEDIIQNGGYTLAANYTDPFKEDGSTCPEIIFAIPYSYIYTAGECGNYCSNKCLHGASQATFGLKSTPWNGSCAVPQFIATYDKDDSRLNDTWLYGVQKDQQGNTIMVDAANNDVLDYSISVHSIDNPGAYQEEGARFHKYEIVAGDQGTYGDDVPFFRLTDAMMIKAECLLRLGGYKGETEQTAADIVTQIRKRAFKDHPEKAIRTVAQLKGPSVYDYGHQENTAKEGESDNWIITHEGGADIELGGFLDDLAWEFVGEHHRKQDLIRFMLTSKKTNVYNGKSWFCKDAETGTDRHKDLFPIPYDIMNGNMKLKQNPGYAD